MDAITLARTYAQAGDTTSALGEYHQVLLGSDGTRPENEMEAACYFFDHGGDYRVAYIAFQSLYNRGAFQEELFHLMVDAFYAPNVAEQQRTYRRNCKLLKAYPYLFRKDLPEFDDLPVKFFPYDDDGFTLFDAREDRFGEYFAPGHTVISRNFFRDLEKPILATDVFSQYELAYLNDNVRRSDWVGRENHIYLHYTDWETFCSYLQCLDLRPLLADEKFVFLIGEEERALYPIDFSARFGIDYSTHPVKPIGIREVKKLIWHTQLSSHNGGDFFNEIFYGHPNLLAIESIMFDDMAKTARDLKRAAGRSGRQGIDNLTATIAGEDLDPTVYRQLAKLSAPTEKDALVAAFLGLPSCRRTLDTGARIVPALFFQPHFYNIKYELSVNTQDRVVPLSAQYDTIRQSPLFQGFDYIKTFTPIRRPTTSHAATVRFARQQAEEESRHLGDSVGDRVLNRSFMIDPNDRLLRDSVMVRFEDGKLNPRATFTPLAAFLDLPYTESMTYCSGLTGIDPESLAGNARGFDPVTVYRTYDDFANGAERSFIEYFMRDVYAAYGYDFHYYDGQPVDEERVRQWIAGFTTLNGHISDSLWQVLLAGKLAIRDDQGVDVSSQMSREDFQKFMVVYIKNLDAVRLQIAQTLSTGLRFVNPKGQPLRMMPLLQPDPTLLDQPLYH